MARFDGKTILISGGARGQGASEARLLVAQGAKVVIGDVLESEGNALASELGAAARFVRHDVTSEAEWAHAVQTAESFGGLHGLINNAGIFKPAFWARPISSCGSGICVSTRPAVSSV